MIVIQYGTGTVDVDVSLGAVDTENPPSPILLVATRKGTNFTTQQQFVLAGGGIIPGNGGVLLTDLDRALFTEAGQYDYDIIWNNGVDNPVLTSGLLDVIEHIQQPPSYGTDRQRKEHKRA